MQRSKPPTGIKFTRPGKTAFVDLEYCATFVPWQELPEWADPECLDCGGKTVYVEAMPGLYEKVCACTYH